MSFPRKTEVEVVHSTGKVKVVHISDVIYVLPTDRIIEKLLQYQKCGRQSI